MALVRSFILALAMAVIASGQATQIPAASGGGGSMVYPGTGIPLSTGSAWGTSVPVCTSIVVLGCLPKTDPTTGNLSIGPTVLAASSIAAPSAPTVSAQGTTGSTSYTYKLSTVLMAGGIPVGTGPMSSPTTIANGNATLGASNFNRLTFPLGSYVITRTGTTGAIGMVNSATHFDDIGYHGYSPSYDTSNAILSNLPISNLQSAVPGQNQYALSGTTAVNGSTTVVGTGTHFATEIGVCDTLLVWSEDGTHIWANIVYAVDDDTHVKVLSPYFEGNPPGSGGVQRMAVQKAALKFPEINKFGEGLDNYTQNNAPRNVCVNAYGDALTTAFSENHFYNYLMVRGDMGDALITDTYYLVDPSVPSNVIDVGEYGLISGHSNAGATTNASIGIIDDLNFTAELLTHVGDSKGTEVGCRAVGFNGNNAGYTLDIGDECGSDHTTVRVKAGPGDTVGTEKILKGTLADGATETWSITRNGNFYGSSFTGTGSDPFINYPSNTGHSAATGDLWNNAGSLKFNNGTATVNLVQNIASGATAMGTSSISSAACATVVTATATNTATTDVVTASFNGDPTAATGYIPATAGMLTIIAYPTANAVNFKVCNNTSSSITPGALTLNWKVVR